LGDHADDAIAAESAVRRRTIETDEIFDDCGDNVEYIELSEEEPEKARVRKRPSLANTPYTEAAAYPPLERMPEARMRTRELAR
jgi:hypothetical protein